MISYSCPPDPYLDMDWVTGNEFAVCLPGIHKDEQEIACGNILSCIVQWFRQLMKKRKAKQGDKNETRNTCPEKTESESDYVIIDIEPDGVEAETKKETLNHSNALLQEKQRTYDEGLERFKEKEKEQNEAIRHLTALLEEKEIERKEHVKRINDLENICAMLEKKNKDIEKRSMDLTREMAKRTDMTGNFEDVNDDQNNSKLAQKFESLYSNKWVMVALHLTKTFRDKTEVENIAFLTDLLKDGYQKCQQAADDQVCSLLHVKSKEDIPVNENISDFIQLRRKYAVKDSVKENVKKDILQKLLQRDDMCSMCSDDKGKKVHTKLTSFLEEYLDCCWLMIVSNPTMVLNFDVVGKLYIDCAEHFKVYSNKKPVEDMSKIEGEIVEVVWPCVKLDNESAIYVKGDVIVVRKGKVSE